MWIHVLDLLTWPSFAAITLTNLEIHVQFPITVHELGQISVHSFLENSFNSVKPYQVGFSINVQLQIRPRHFCKVTSAIRKHLIYCVFKVTVLLHDPLADEIQFVDEHHDVFLHNVLVQIRSQSCIAERKPPSPFTDGITFFHGSRPM